MQPILAASLLDNPWVILVFILGSAVVNWLASRRKQAMEDEAEVAEEAGPEAVPPARRVAADPELEEVLRRFLGKGQPPFREAPPVPPPLVPPATPARVPSGGGLRVPPPPLAAGVGEGGVPIPGNGGRVLPSEAGPLAGGRAKGARKPARAARSAPGPAVQPTRPLVAALRSRAGAREAWKLSVILGPPGGLEP